MKKILTISLILAFGFIISTSCKKEHPKKVAKIDSIVLKIDSTLVLFNKIVKDSVANRNEFFKNSLPVITGLLSNETKPEEKNMLQRWGMCKKPFRDYLENYDKINKELDFSKTQLLSLRASVKSDNIPKDSIDIYINQELSASNNIINETSIVCGRLNIQMAEYDTLKPQIDQFIEKYSQLKISKLNK